MHTHTPCSCTCMYIYMYIYIYIHPLELFDQVDINDSVAGASPSQFFIFSVLTAICQGATPRNCLAKI